MSWAITPPITRSSVSYTHLDVYKRQGHCVGFVAGVGRPERDREDLFALDPGAQGHGLGHVRDLSLIHISLVLVDEVVILPLAPSRGARELHDLRIARWRSRGFALGAGRGGRFVGRFGSLGRRGSSAASNQGREREQES